MKLMQDQLKKRLKQAIVNSGLSHRTLESITGISRTTIFRYANEQVDKIPFVAIEKIANVTNTDLKWLIGLDDEIKENENNLGEQLVTLLSSLTEEEKEKAIEYIKFIQSQKNKSRFLTYLLLL